MKLPRGYLSWSQYDIWSRSKEEYKKRYFIGKKPPESMEATFGKKIAKLIETDPTHDEVKDIPRLASPEHRIEAEIDGVRVLGFLDSYCPDTGKFLEYKTGRKPWTASRVRKHGQLPFYAMLIETLRAERHPETTLIWIPTSLGPAPFYEIVRNGPIVNFPRVIEGWEVKRMREEVVRVAGEISEYYESFIKETIV